ncbi:dihydrofolate reductase [Pseudoalteromonas phage J2-1_QLiu-2017]|nr:dihydrofolate reductase [Pseudoalteromonas phage J2-1_QLiu-2017]
MSKIIGIVAHGTYGEIGADNSLLWSLPKDLAMFKTLTTNNFIIMGRNTFESLNRPKGLPNRVNLVVSSKKDEKSLVQVLHPDSIFDIIHFIKRNHPTEDIYVIGGAQLYRFFEKHNIIDEWFVTEVEKEYPKADTLFRPNLFNFKLSENIDVSSEDITATMKHYIREDVE